MNDIHSIRFVKATAAAGPKAEMAETPRPGVFACPGLPGLKAGIWGWLRVRGTKRIFRLNFFTK
jgi:hypothetical protein